MKSSIFSYLVSYVPTDKRESKEDYLTQMFAWILENIEGIASTYIQELCKKGNIVIEDNNGFDVEVSTQTVVPNGRIDLLLRVNKKVAFICEHKVHSELSENQIKKYMDDSKLLGPEKFYSVLVTFSSLQHTQPADVSIIWSDIYEMVEEVIHNYDGEDAFVLAQFMKYLAENGMGKAELIQPEAMLGYWPAINLEYKLDRIFRQIETVDFQKLCPGLEELGDGYAPSYTKSRWGRLGIDFFSNWNKMGVFAGVLMHTTDHHLWPYDVEKGPDLVVFLESDYSRTDSKKRETYENNIHSEKYRKMISKLAEDSDSFDFLPGISESPWRIAVLRRPLYDVLIGKYKQSEQVDAIMNEIVKAINMYINAMR